MTTAQVVETSVTVNNNSPIQDYVHPDYQIQPTFEMTPGFNPFKVFYLSLHFQNSLLANAPIVPLSVEISTNDSRVILVSENISEIWPTTTGYTKRPGSIKDG